MRYFFNGLIFGAICYLLFKLSPVLLGFVLGMLFGLFLGYLLPAGNKPNK